MSENDIFREKYLWTIAIKIHPKYGSLDGRLFDN